MKTAAARGGTLDGLVICSRYDEGVLVADKVAGTAELYIWRHGAFYAEWDAPRTIDWDKLNATVDGPQYDVMAHPKAGEQ
jgi:hypothetical protein